MDKVLERIVECIGPKHGAKKDLAMHLDIHPNVITNWLGGRNKSYMKYLDQIAEFYGVSVQYLKNGEESPKEKPADSGRPKLEDADIAFYERYSQLSEDEKEDMRDFLDLMINRRKRREKGE